MERGLKKLLLTVAFITALTFTCRISIFTQNPLGIFAFSEPLFMLSALLLGPFCGMLVGGIGFALSTLLLGYTHYIIASFIVYAAAGFVIGRLNHTEHHNKLIGIISTLILVVLSTLAGTTIYVGQVYVGFTKTLFMGEEIMKVGGLYAYLLYVPFWFWIIVATLTAITSIQIALRRSSRYLWTSATLLAGCITITIVYFLYEAVLISTLFNIKIDATTNIIVNLGHSVISANIAALIYWFIKWFSR